MKSYIDVQGQRFHFFVVTKIDLDIVDYHLIVPNELHAKAKKIGVSVEYLIAPDAYILIPNKVIYNNKKNITIFAKHHDIPHVIGRGGRYISRLEYSIGKNITVRPYFDTNMCRLTAKIKDYEAYKDIIRSLDYLISYSDSKFPFFDIYMEAKYREQAVNYTKALNKTFPDIQFRITNAKIIC